MASVPPLYDTNPRTWLERAAYLWRLARSEGAGIYLFIPLLLTIAALAARAAYTKMEGSRRDTKALVERLLSSEVEPMIDEARPSIVTAAVSIIAGSQPPERTGERARGLSHPPDCTTATRGARDARTREYCASLALDALATPLQCVGQALAQKQQDVPGAKRCFRALDAPARAEADRLIERIAADVEVPRPDEWASLPQAVERIGPCVEVERERAPLEAAYGPAGCDRQAVLSFLIVPAPLDRCPPAEAPCYDRATRIGIHFSMLFELVLASLPDDIVPKNRASTSHGRPLFQAYIMSAEGVGRLWGPDTATNARQFYGLVGATRRWNAAKLYRQYFEGGHVKAGASRPYIDQANGGVVATVCRPVGLGPLPVSVVCGDFKSDTLDPKGLDPDGLLLVGTGELRASSGSEQSVTLDDIGTLLSGDGIWQPEGRSAIEVRLARAIPSDADGPKLNHVLPLLVDEEWVYFVPLERLTQDSWRVMFIRARFPGLVPRWTIIALVIGLLAVAVLMVGVGKRVAHDRLMRDDAILRHLQAGVINTNERGVIDYGNDRAEEILGVELPNPALRNGAAAAVQAWHDLLEPQVIPKPDLDRIVSLEEIERWRKEGRRRGYYARLKMPDGISGWIEVRGTPFLSASKREYQPTFGLLTPVPVDRARRLDVLMQKLSRR